VLPLEELFDCRVAVAQAVPTDVTDALYPEELALVAAAVPKRRAEFATGRACARRALAALGVTACPVLRDRDRAPIWPAGVVGSITHTDGYCAVVVARTEDARSVGLDAERDLPFERALEATVFTPAERRWLDAHSPEERDRLATLLFSSKEAFYKCQHPITNAALDFLDVELVVQLDEGRFRVGRILPAGADWSRVHGARGRFRREGGLIVTGVSL
jgi:4'-phosphopantetheinyl transferase EntD